MKTKLFFLFTGLLLMCLLTDAAANPINNLNNENDLSQWKRMTEKIDSLLKNDIGDVGPGGSVGILWGKNKTFQKGYGYNDVSTQSPNTPTTVLGLSSVSKHFTVYAILLLEQQGLLRIDDPIGKYLPDLPDFRSEVTVRNLIQHTSGIASTDVIRLLSNLSFEDDWTQSDEINLIKLYPQLNTKPNEMYSYSNSGYVLLAEIIEKVSGMHYASFMELYVFHPLSMKLSYVYYSPEQADKIVTKGYKKEQDSFIPYQVSRDYCYGSSNIYSSVSDMCSWGKHILSDNLSYVNYLSLISEPYNTLINGDTINYTYGFSVKDDMGVRQVSHSGGTLGFRSQFVMYPEQDLLIVILLNTESVNSAQLVNKISQIILGDLLVEATDVQRKEIILSSRQMDKYTGFFQMPDGLKLEVELNTDTLMLKLPGDESFRLYPETENSFFLKDFNAQCRFVIGAGGEVNELIWYQGGSEYSARRLTKVLDLSVEEKLGYVGNYVHEVLEVGYPVSLNDEQLVLHTPQTFETYLGVSNVVLDYLGDNKFFAGRLGIVEFSEDEGGCIKEMVIKDVGRVKNFRLKKVHK